MTTAMWALRVFLGSLFLVSALRKIRARHQFDTVVFLLTGVFRRLYKRIGDLVLVSEIAIGVALVANLAPMISLAGGLILMLVFDVVLVVLLIGHPGLACGCFGSKSEDGVRSIDLIRNVAITGSFIGLLIWQCLNRPSPHFLADVSILIVIVGLIAVGEYRLHKRHPLNARTGTRDA